MKLLAVGDTHANPRFFRQVCEQARDSAANVILQLGDFGWWPHTNWGQRFLEQAEQDLERVKLPCYFIDGNHEDYPALWLGTDDGQSLDGNPFIRRGGSLFYIPRATHWTWGEPAVSFFAMGGAHSVDRKWRKKGAGYWDDEDIRLSDIDRALERPHAQVMFTHDAPEGTSQEPWLTDGGDWPAHDVRLSKKARGNLRQVVEHIKPDLLLHGHLHHRYTDTLKLSDGHPVHVEGLNCDQVPDEATYLLDTDNL